MLDGKLFVRGRCPEPAWAIFARLRSVRVICGDLDGPLPWRIRRLSGGKHGRSGVVDASCRTWGRKVGL